MNSLNNLITLTSAALLSGFLDARVLRLRANGTVTPGALPAGCDIFSGPNAVACFQQHGFWPDDGPLLTKKGVAQARDLFSAPTKAGVIGFGQTFDGVDRLNVCRRLSGKDIEHIVSQFDSTRPSNKVGDNTVGAADNATQVTNYYVAKILCRSNPTKWTMNMNVNVVNHIVRQKWTHFTLGQVNNMNASVVEHYAVAVLTHLQDHGRVNMIKPHILKAILKNAAAVQEITSQDFEQIVKNPELAKIFRGDIFVTLPKAVQQTTSVGKFVRNLPNDVFSQITDWLHPDFTVYATSAQLSNWQAKSIKNNSCFLDAENLPASAASSIDFKVWVKFFEDNKSFPNNPWVMRQVASFSKWQFWKRIPLKVIKKLAENHDIMSFQIPWEAFKVMTKEQRQVILEAGDKSSPNTTCANLPLAIFKGKESRRAGLKASKACFEAKLGSGHPNAAKFLFHGLISGMFDPKIGKKLEPTTMANFTVKVKRNLKKGPDGKDIKKDDYEFHGFLALEGLQALPNGAEFVKAFLHSDNANVPVACGAIQVDSLKKARWLQPLLNKDCVKNIPGITMDDAKKLHPHVVSLLSKAQVEALGDKDDLKDLEGTIVEGLAGNRAFAKMSCEKREKTNKEGDDVEKKPLMILIKASERSKYFGHKYVMNLPSEDDCQRYMAAHIASFADDALAGSDAAWIAGHSALMQNIRPEQYGHISDNVEAGSYPSSLQAGAASSMSIDRVKNLSSKFVSRMSASALGAFSADQVKAIPASSLVEVCGADKHAALKGLSDEQKASLGKSCAAKEGSMAPVNAHVGAFAAVVAAAAGSFALLL